MAWTRESSLEDLVIGAELELEHFQKYGVGCIEAKSGYGLTLESELRLLETIKEVQKRSPVWLVPTFMPAHTTPPEFRGRTQDYVDEICRHWIPEVTKRKMAVFFDVFVETGYFSLQQARQLCEAAISHGLKIKLHCEQFGDLGSTALAVDLKAASCDHLDHISDANIKKLAESETTAVLLPGASLFTGTPYPPARKLIDAGARVALSTDFNPGTCPSRNLPLMTTLACSQMKMTVPEALAAITYNAAAALSLESRLGSLEVGKSFRVCQLKGRSYEIVPYCFGELE
jgi:imidazolonepropionase